MAAVVHATPSGIRYLDCDCIETQIRFRTRSNGTGAYVIQCLTCGREVHAISKRSPEVLALTERVLFDEALREAWGERQRNYWAHRLEEQEQERERKDTDWWRWYNAYLLSPAWKAKRQKVLERAGGMCEGCLTRYATQVHHKSYDHAGEELLFELVAVCDRCHRVLHPDMDE